MTKKVNPPHRPKGTYVTHCKYGHPFEGDNIKVDARTGNRRCRICLDRVTKENNAKRKRKRLAEQAEMEGEL